MRLGLIARADSRGLGVQTKAFHDQMHPAKTLVVDCPSAMPLPIRKDWYPNASWVNGLPGPADFRTWLDGLDAVYTAETGYGQVLWIEAQRAGVRTVLHANYEFLNRNDSPTIWAAPSLWHIDQWPTGTIHLPVPIETERFPQTDWPAVATNFLHVIGRPAVHDRNGTIDLLLALQHIKADITVTITCQQSGYVGGLINAHGIRTPGNVTLRIESRDTQNYWDNYAGQHALILPRRFGGLCLPANEAIGAGIPVVMPNIAPNNLWLPAEWLTHASYAGEFRAKQRIQYHRSDPHALAQKIDQLATDSGFYAQAKQAAARLRDRMSWAALKPEYDKALCSVSA